MTPRTEAANKAKLLNSSIVDYFTVHSERRGRPLFTKAIKRLYDGWGTRSLKRGYVIDFVLEPKQSLIQEGWELGCVGVEAKPSPLRGRNFGKAVSQILDYQASAFRLLNEVGDECELSMIFLLGPDRFHGTEASVLMQEGIGLIRISDFQNEVKFLHGNGNHPILTIRGDLVEYRRPRFGMGSGHR